MNIILASHNEGKIQEFNLLLQSLNVTIIPIKETSNVEIEETGLSFIENALIKARHASWLTKRPALADDSGLVIPFLKGAPGIYSARYAGQPSDAKKNIKKVLRELSSASDDHRDAYFYCVLAFMLHEEDPTPLICQGKWAGLIAREPIGDNGFGYDPIFYIPSENQTAAQLSMAIKNQISHRALAARSLLHFLPEKLYERRIKS